MIASSISFALGRSGRIRTGRISVVDICVIRDAVAAPDVPHLGIRRKFKITLITAALMERYFKYFCLFSQTIHAFLATPK